MQDGGVLPVTGFPRVDGMANKEERARNKRARCKHMVHLRQHAFGPRRSFRVIPSKRFNETVRIRSGVEEVGVHGTSSEVVVHVATVVVHVFVDVHVDGSGTRDIGVLVSPVLAV